MTDAVKQIDTPSYKGDDRRRATVAIDHPERRLMRGIVGPLPAAGWQHENQHYGDPNAHTAGGENVGVLPANRVVSSVPHRVSFKVTEISRTSLGVSRITLAAQHNSMNTLGDSANPKGTITMEVDGKFADTIPLGAAFMLVSA